MYLITSSPQVIPNPAFQLQRDDPLRPRDLHRDPGHHLPDRIFQGFETLVAARLKGEDIDCNLGFAVGEAIHPHPVKFDSDLPGKRFHLLRGRDEHIDVVFPAPQTFEAVPQDIPLDIIYQDADIAVLNKQAGLIVHPSRDNPDGTLVNGLLYHIKDLSGINGVLRPGIVHRLDKDTTGVLVISKTDRAHRALSLQFAERTLRKKYLAVVWGTPREAEGVIDKPLKRSRKDIRKIVVDSSGKEAVTE